MANIQVKDLQPAGIELFADNESFLTELNEHDLNYVKGGTGTFICTFGSCRPNLA